MNPLIAYGIAGLLIVVGGTIGYLAGRSRQRHIDIWAPGPPVADDIPESFPEQPEHHFKENVWDVLREQNPEMAKDFADIVQWRPEEFVRLVPRYPSKTWTAPTMQEPTLSNPSPVIHMTIPEHLKSETAGRLVTWGLVKRMGGKLNDWDPPDADEWIVAAAQGYWMNLYGDPTKKEAD